MSIGIVLKFNYKCTGRYWDLPTPGSGAPTWRQSHKQWHGRATGGARAEPGGFLQNIEQCHIWYHIASCIRLYQPIIFEPLGGAQAT